MNAGTLDVVVDADGSIRAIYSDDLAPILRAVGSTTVRRASNVEPDGDGWAADLSPVDGPTLHHDRREDALAAEVAWLREHDIPQPHTK